MLGLMESPFHHFFDDRTDAAARDTLIRADWYATLVNTKTTARHRPDEKLLTFLKDLQSRRGLCRVNLQYGCCSKAR